MPLLFLWNLEVKSWAQHGIMKYLEVVEDFALITGSHGVSSSEWFPINQSYSGYKYLSDGIIVSS